MSNIFTYLVRETNGVIPLNIGDGPLVDPLESQGLNIDRGGAIFANEGGIVAHYNSGLPFDEDGRLLIDFLTPPVRFDQSIPFTATNRVAVSGQETSYFNQGIAYVEGGGLSAVASSLFNMDVAQTAVNLAGFDYTSFTVDQGSVTPRNGFDILNGGNTFYDRVTGSDTTDNFVIRFSEGPLPNYIRLDGSERIDIFIKGVGRAITAPFRDDPGLLDYYISGDRIPGFGDAMNALIGQTTLVIIRWKPLPP